MAFNPIKSMGNGVGDFFSGIAGNVGGAVLGYKLGSNFGFLGKLAGAATMAWVGGKLTKEVVADVRGAMQYSDANTKEGGLFTKSKKPAVSTVKAMISNFANFGGQDYNMHTVDPAADSEPDV